MRQISLMDFVGVITLLMSWHCSGGFEHSRDEFDSAVVMVCVTASISVWWILMQSFPSGGLRLSGCRRIIRAI